MRLELILATMLLLPPVAAAGAECVGDYRSLPADHGWRRYRIVGDQHCWYVTGAHAARAPAHAPHAEASRAMAQAPPAIAAPPPVPAAAVKIADDYPARRIESLFMAAGTRDDWRPPATAAPIAVVGDLPVHALSEPPAPAAVSFLVAWFVAGAALGCVLGTIRWKYFLRRRRVSVSSQ
jgi:hypothetical protein